MDILSLIKSVLPDLLDWIKTYHQDKGSFPTVEELNARIDANTARYIMIGENWLKDHPPHDSEKSNNSGESI